MKRTSVRSALRRYPRLVLASTAAVALVGLLWAGTSPTLPGLGHSGLDHPGGVALVAIGAVLGALLSAVAAAALANASHRFERVTDPESVYGTHLVAMVPTFDPPIGGHAALPVLTHPGDEAAESYRTLATVLRARRGEAPVLVVALSGAEVGAGTTTAVANCGLALAEMGERVLVVDGDPLSRGLTRALLDTSLDASGFDVLPMGLSELLEGRPLAETVFPAMGNTGLMVVPSGRSTDMAVHRWRSSTLRAALYDLSQRVDIILIDTPPMGTSSFSLDLAGVAGHLVLVVPHLDPVEPHETLAHRLPAIGVELLGYVYNGSPSNTRFAPYFPVVRDARHSPRWDTASPRGMESLDADLVRAQGSGRSGSPVS